MYTCYLDPEKAVRILVDPRLSDGLQKYLYLQQDFHNVDVSKNTQYQRVFRNFWALSTRYKSIDDSFIAGYFQILENYKKDDMSPTFSDAFQRVHAIGNTLQMSFTSKLVHMLNTDMPVWDSIVAEKHFHFKKPYSYVKNPDIAFPERYAEYNFAFQDYLQTDNAKELISLFNYRFPKARISDIKKIDFILWRDR